MIINTGRGLSNTKPKRPGRMRCMKIKKDILIFTATVIVVAATMGVVSASVPHAWGMSQRAEHIFHYVLFFVGIGVIYAVRYWLWKRPK